MSASIDVPLTITSEAAIRIAELGLRTELEQMIAHVREVVPDLAAIEVVREPPYDTDSDSVSITAYSDRAFAAEEKTSRKLSRWAVETFAPQVLEHLVILLSPGRPHAR